MKRGKIVDTNVTKDVLGNILIRTYRVGILPEVAFGFLSTCNCYFTNIFENIHAKNKGF